jgi:pimeloyl-ACP methyl ester carboxylesterase
VEPRTLPPKPLRPSRSETFPYPERVFLYEGVPIMCFDSGHKRRPTILFVHGLGSNQTTFEYVAGMMEHRGFRVCGLDLPGFGLSGKPVRDYTVSFFSGAVIALMDQLGLDQVVLCGHSLGGLVVADAAMRAPGRVADLVLISPAGLFKMHWPARLAARMIMRPTLLAPLFEKNAKRILEWVYGTRNERTERFIEQSLTRPDPRFCLDLARVMAATKRDLTSYHLFGHEEKLAMPTLVIWGGRDRLLPSGRVAAWTRRLPNGTLEVLEQCGHMSIIEDPEGVVAALTAFLRKSSLTSRGQVSQAS